MNDPLVLALLTVAVTVINQALSWALYRPSKASIEATAAEKIKSSAIGLVEQYQKELCRMKRKLELLEISTEKEIAELRCLVESHEARYEEMCRGVKILTSQLIGAEIEPEWTP